MYWERSVNNEHDLLNLGSEVMSNGNGQDASEWDEEDVRAILLNPVYTMGSSPTVSNEQWILAQQKLLGELGADEYLKRLLTVIHETFARVVE